MSFKGSEEKLKAIIDLNTAEFLTSEEALSMHEAFGVYLTRVGRTVFRVKKILSLECRQEVEDSGLDRNSLVTLFCTWFLPSSTMVFLPADHLFMAAGVVCLPMKWGMGQTFSF